MNPDERHMLEQTLKLSEENNSILLKMRRSARVSNIMHVIYWIIIIAISYGAYVYVQPYVNQVLGLFNQAESVMSGARGNSTTSQ